MENINYITKNKYNNLSFGNEKGGNYSKDTSKDVDIFPGKAYTSLVFCSNFCLVSIFIIVFILPWLMFRLLHVSKSLGRLLYSDESHKMWASTKNKASVRNFGRKSKQEKRSAVDWKKEEIKSGSNLPETSGTKEAKSETMDKKQDDSISRKKSEDNDESISKAPKTQSTHTHKHIKMTVTPTTERSKKQNEMLSSRVWTWGWGSHGALGHGSYEDEKTPRAIKTLDDKQVVDINSGWAHACAIDMEGNCYRWGWIDDVKTTYSCASFKMNASHLLYRMQAFAQATHLGWLLFDNGTLEPTFVNDLKSVPIAKYLCGAATNFALAYDGK
ncbi:alsin, partial [Reticulomyxa filosa]